MPFNGSGTYSLPSGNPVVTNTPISSTVHNATTSDIASALTNCVTRDGQSPPTAPLPMGNQKITGLAKGTVAGDAVRYEQAAKIDESTGANSDIKSLSGLTTPLSVAQGGTGSSTAPTTTGTGDVVLNNSPTLITPVLGTPSSGNLSNCTFPTLNQNTTGSAASATTATSANGLKTASGIVSVSSATAPSTGQVLVATSGTAATWQSLPTGTGTVTSVAMTVPSFLSVTGSPITSTGTLAVSLSGTALPVLNGGTGVTTSTGSGNVVLSTSPTLVTPILGTPTSGTLTSCTGLPLSTGVSGTLPVLNGGTGVTTSTGSGNNVLSTSPTLVAPILGTPTSGTLTSCTGLPISSGVSGLGTNVATFLATPSSANLAAALTDETGTGSAVFANAPTFPAQINLTANSGYNIYASGTADNYLAGSLGIGGVPVAFSKTYLSGVCPSNGFSANGSYYDLSIPSTATVYGAGITMALSTENNATVTPSLLIFNATQGTITGGVRATLPNQYGFTADSTLTGATNNYGFYGGINASAGTTRYNLYMAGTADNYLAGSLGIGTTVPSSALHVSGGGVGANNATITIDVLGGDLGDYSALNFNAVNTNNLGAIRSYVEASYLSNMRFYTAGATATLTERMRIDSSGNVGIGTSSPDANSRLTIGSTPVVTNSTAQLVNPTFASASTGLATGVYTILSTAAASFTVNTMTGFKAAQDTIGAASAVTNQYGYLAESSLTGATNNVGFFGNIAAASGRYNFYAPGTAVNAFSGDVNIFGAGKLGYTTGSGGTVTQATSRTTAVTLNKTNGSITVFSALGITTYQSFDVSNSTVSATDVVVLTMQSGLSGKYSIIPAAITAGGFRIAIAALGAVYTEAPIINFAVIKAVNA